MVRARWGTRLKGSPLMSTAAAFESVTDELTFVVGPLLATALCTAVTPSAGLVTEAALTLVGGLLFAAQRGTQPPVPPRGTLAAAEGEAHAQVSALRVPGVRVLIVTFLGIGSVFGGMQVSLAAFTESIGEPGLNGVLYGVFAAGNMLSGVVCGAVAWKSTPGVVSPWATRVSRWPRPCCGRSTRCRCWPGSGCWSACVSRPR